MHVFDVNTDYIKIPRHDRIMRLQIFSFLQALSFCIIFAMALICEVFSLLFCDIFMGHFDICMITFSIFWIIGCHLTQFRIRISMNEIITLSWSFCLGGDSFLRINHKPSIIRQSLSFMLECGFKTSWHIVVCGKTLLCENNAFKCNLNRFCDDLWSSVSMILFLYQFWNYAWITYFDIVRIK